MIAYAYVRCGSKSEMILSGKQTIMFPRTPAKTSAVPSTPAPRVNMELEGLLGTLQNKCYHDLVQACKDIALGIGHNIQWTTIMSVQVG